MTRADLLDRERRHIAQLLAGLAVAGLSGFVTYLNGEHGGWQQWTYLLHTLVGLYLAVVLVPYVGVHFKRTLGTRRPALVVSGILAISAVLALVVSGLHISLFGQRERLRWIYDLHIVTSYAALVVLVLHVAAHRLLLPSRRRHDESVWFASLTFASIKPSLVGIGTSIGVVVLATLFYSLVPLSYKDDAVIKPYERAYGEHPFRPSQTETASGTFVDVRRISGSDKCAVCHAQIAREWRASMHSQAASDKTYQTNANLLAGNKGMAATRYCEGCHAPVALLTGQLTKGGRLDTHGHMHEGVSCMTCHGIDQVMHLKGVGSYRFTPKNDYLFADRDALIPNKIHNYLIRIQPRQHRNDLGRAILKSPQLCATCHAQFMDKDVNNWGWVKMQDDYTAWLDSPYSGQSQQPFTLKQITRCQDCHMPLVESRDPSANANNHVRSHRTLGANTAIPWYKGDTEQLALITEFLQGDKVRVSIERPNRPGATRSRMPIDPRVATEAEAPVYFYLGETVDLSVIVTNSGVGHEFPGGTIDINEVWIQLRVVDAQNNIVYESGALTDNNDVDPKAHFYRSIPIDRHGKHVWRHDLFNMVGESYKKVIPSGASDIVHYSFKISSWAKSPLTISAVVRYRKFNNRYARWALKDDTIRLPIVDMARDTMSIPVRHKAAVERSVGPRTQ